ncbi:MAG: hypothetical protein E4G95_01665 [Bacteroidia bacterium]|nr:MAG: hypothetical protein E4G95_01665 [Bacteroidia bacterium]
MKTKLLCFLILFSLVSCTPGIKPGKGEHDLVFPGLASTWDEAIPLGNGMLGALVWKRDSMLRISLDRADLWDLRPMTNLDFSQVTYEWVYDQWKNGDYSRVQEVLDVPYDKRPAPTKIPAAALEFDISSLGDPSEVRLLVDNALCQVTWENGAILTVFVDASSQAGWFRFENTGSLPGPSIIPPAYSMENSTGPLNNISEADLVRLGYSAGEVLTGVNEIFYNQEGWGGFEYSVGVKWADKPAGMEGCWSISSTFPGWEESSDAKEIIDESQVTGYNRSLQSHLGWWQEYWNRSSVDIPDRVIEKQYYLEMYKFGSAARENTPPISLQAIWTADNGRLPPWKGDFHHDLNTQLSYWPAYSSNHTDLASGFVNWLWKYKPAFEKYTRAYYNSDGLNVPGVTTLDGEPMGGWIQYSLGPTVSAWLGHHFYLQWRYTMNRIFLEERAYPWLAATARHFDNISITGSDGLRKLPISSSPEINDNSKEAWFGETTNFDLALIRWTYSKAAELATELGLTGEAEKWLSRLNEWPLLAYDDSGLLFAPGYPYEGSHRHFSHLMGWHPLGLVDYSNGPEDREIIQNTLQNLSKYGSDYWTGYSFSWQANLYARAFMGEEASNALKIFAEAFCLPNSFHVNGDQTEKGYSKYRYRPFTLEGNFAFAAALQEMLIQSHTGVVNLFPAVPGDWSDISFSRLRTEGAFLVSAELSGGKPGKVVIESEAGGKIRIRNSYNTGILVDGKPFLPENPKEIVLNMEKGEIMTIEPVVNQGNGNK